jgi:hypothetical protein
VSRKVVIRIQGYGKIKVKHPKKMSRKAYSDLIAQVVAETLDLVVPTPAKWHPVMGFKK